MLNALVWGVSWWPLRELQYAGLHPLWSTVIIFVFALICILAWRPMAWRGMAQHPALWVLMLASGLTNVGFNWAVTTGDVVRVVLLFYLMPGWSILLAWAILGDRPTRGALLRLVLAFAGLLMVLLPSQTQASLAVPALSTADGLAILGGFSFALTNVMLRRLNHTPGESRMFAMFGGGALLALATGAVGLINGTVAPLPAINLHWGSLALCLALAFLAGNLALQYAAARLAAGTTALVMLTEVVFASVSSTLLGAATLEPRTLMGGALIIAAALAATWPAGAPRSSTDPA
jgi:drug/metabolite transporter (DMT)-like permease